jgi:3-oxoacyl-[acyl-carrier-protein] synthase-1
MRAGVERKQELPYRDNMLEPIIGSLLDILEDGSSAQRRSEELLAFAVADALKKWRQLSLARTEWIVSLPAGAQSAHELAKILSEKTGTAVNGDVLRIISEGAYGSYRALADARTLLLTNQCEAVVVCAADSLVTAPTLLRLSEQRRLLTSENSDGVIPGEAGACVVLTRRAKQACGAILGLGFGREPALQDNEIPLRADGLVAAARSALDEASLRMHDMDYRLSDAAGEGYHFKEQALVVGRVLRERKEVFPLWLAAETLGAVGAASGLCNLVWALRSFARGVAPGPRALAWAGNDGSDRSAVVIEGRRRQSDNSGDRSEARAVRPQ